MAQFFPFRGYWLDPVRIEQEKLFSPVNEFISSGIQKTRLPHHKSSFPEQIFRFDQVESMQDDEFPFEKIEEKISILNQEGKIKQDREPAIYEVLTAFHDPISGGVVRRFGLVAVMRLDDDGKIVYPHENTFEDAVKERARLFSGCSYQFDPVFMIYPGNYQKEVILAQSQRRKMFEFRGESGERHEVYKISEPLAIRKLVQFLNDKFYLIADGHHRYNAALKSEGKSILVYLVGSEDEGLRVSPIHRLFRGSPKEMEILDSLIKQNFQNEEIDELELRNFPLNLPLEMRTSEYFGYLSASQTLILKNNWKSNISSLNLFDKLIVKKMPSAIEVNYDDKVDSCIDYVKSGNYSSCLLVNNISVSQIWNRVKGGELYPEKSTFFYPKILGGMLIYKAG